MPSEVIQAGICNLNRSDSSTTYSTCGAVQENVHIWNELGQLAAVWKISDRCVSLRGSEQTGDRLDRRWESYVANQL